MSGPLVLSLFPGMGLLDLAFEREGFTVVRGPDPLWGGDIRRFNPPPRRFDGVIGGPPCQLFSVLRRLNKRAGCKTGNLIPEFARCVREAVPEWWLMENVPAAPLPEVGLQYAVTSTLVRDVEVGGETSRTRRFTFGALPTYGPFQLERLALYVENPKKAVTTAGGGKATGVMRHQPMPELLQAQGLPGEFLADSPFTDTAKRKGIGNGVPLAMGQSVAQAVTRSMAAHELAKLRAWEARENVEA